MSSSTATLWPGVAPLAHGERERTADRERKRAGRASTRDVEIPPVADPARREACRLDLPLYCATYEPAAFPHPFSRDHLVDLADIQDTILTHGKTAKAGPRGDGKTTRARAAIRWSLLYGHVRFAFLLTDIYKNSSRNLKIIRRGFEKNPLLYEDFPWICACARALRGAYNRGNTQTIIHDGERVLTGIQFSGGLEDLLIAPTIPGVPESGFLIAFGSMDGALRGINYEMDNGAVARPDLVFCDDPQKREHSENEEIVEKNIRILMGDVLGQAGPGQNMAVIYRGSIIAENDMTAQMIDHKLHPDMRGRLCKLLYAEPSAVELWKQYEDIRYKSFDIHSDIRLATALYGAHRCKPECEPRLDQPRECDACPRAPMCMDAHAVIAWVSRQRRGELSAVQDAMELRIERGTATFAAEFQSEPRPRSADQALVLDSYRVERAFIPGRGRGVVPNDALALILGVDVNKFGLTWALAAAAPGRRIAVVDYGVQDVDAPVGHIDPDADIAKYRALELALLTGLRKLRDKFTEHPYRSEDGRDLHPTLALIDSRWMGNIVFAFCAEPLSRARWFPFMGCGTAAGMGRFYPPKDAQISRDRCMYVKIETIEIRDPETGALSRGPVRRFYCHADSYKKMLHTGFFIEPEQAGSVRLFEPAHRKDHHSYARHLTAEIEVEKSPGVFVWKPRRSENADNHFLDASYATLAGVSILETSTLPSLGVAGLASPCPERAERVERAPHLTVTEVEI